MPPGSKQLVSCCGRPEWRLDRSSEWLGRRSGDAAGCADALAGADQRAGQADRIVDDDVKKCAVHSLIVGLYLFVLLGIGWWCHRTRISGMTDLLPAGRRLGVSSSSIWPEPKPVVKVQELFALYLPVQLVRKAPGVGPNDPVSLGVRQEISNGRCHRAGVIRFGDERADVV